MRGHGFGFVPRVTGTVATAAAVLAVAGCAHQVDGLAQPARTVDAERGYGYVDDRCGLLTNSSVQAALDADEVTRPYSGAVCQYVLSRGSVMLDVTFSWFDTGDLDRERAVAVNRGAQVSDTIIERRPGFLARRDTTGAACAATASAGGGVLSWWVQVRSSSADVCSEAQRLLSATLKSDM